MLSHEGFHFRFTGFDFRSSSFFVSFRQNYVVIALKRKMQVDGEKETRPFASAALTLQSLQCDCNDKAFSGHLPKTFGNFHGKVHRVKNVFHLTQVPLVYALVTKTQDGGIAINGDSLWKLVNGTYFFIEKFSTGKQDYLFKIPLIPGNFPV